MSTSITARGRALRLVYVYVAAAAAVIALAAVLLSFSGFSVANAADAAWRGAFGSADAVLSSTLVRSIPFMLLGTAVALAFRVGVFNIGGDGQFLIGAALATSVALAPWSMPGWVHLILALGAGAAGGALWGLMPALLRRRWGVFEVLSTLMMNFVAVHVISYLVRGPLQEPTRIYPQSSTFAEGVRLPSVLDGTRLHVGIYLAIVICVLGWIWLFSRESGLRARLTGANPIAAESAGRIDTARTSFRVFIVSAALCGLAGSVEVLGVTFALYENLSPGYGFIGVAVALLAVLHPLGVLASAVVLAAIDAGAGAMQRDAGIPSVTAWAVQALLVLAVLAGRALVNRARAQDVPRTPVTA